MPVPKQPILPSVSIDLARIVMRYASDIGLNGPRIWRRCGLDPGLLQDRYTRLPASIFDAFWQAVEKEAGYALFGLRLGQAVKDYAGGHVLYTILLNSPTVGTALEKFCRYHGILSNVVMPRLVEMATSPGIVLKVFPGVLLDLGQETFIFSLFASIIGNLTGSDENIEEIRFSGAAPEDISAYQRGFGCPIRFRCPCSAIVLPKHIMERPVFLANPDLLAEIEPVALKMIEQFSIEGTVHHKTARIIGRMLFRGEKPTLDAVAKVLGMSVRRLQQKLKNEDSGYREILDLVRKQTAQRLLLNPDYTISEITFILGFSEQSGFTHAFQAWTGTTPGKYRAIPLRNLNSGK